MDALTYLKIFLKSTLGEDVSYSLSGLTASYFAKYSQLKGGMLNITIPYKFLRLMEDATDDKVFVKDTLVKDMPYYKHISSDGRFEFGIEVFDKECSELKGLLVDELTEVRRDFFSPLTMEVSNEIDDRKERVDFITRELIGDVGYNVVGKQALALEGKLEYCHHLDLAVSEETFERIKQDTTIMDRRSLQNTEVLMVTKQIYGGVYFGVQVDRNIT